MKYSMYVQQTRFFTVTVDYDEVEAWCESGSATYDDIDCPEQMVPDFIEDCLYVDPDQLGHPYDKHSREGGPTEIEIVSNLLNESGQPINAETVLL